MTRLRVILAIVLGLATTGIASAQPQANPRAELTAYIDGLARLNLALRGSEIAAIKDRPAAEERRAWARKTVLDLIGGLPARRTPLNARTYGSVTAGDIRVEKIVFESLPGYRIPANVYVPAGKGPFPAVLMSPGHTANGKISGRALSMHLARAGILVMVYDITGQGERFQYWDADKKASAVGSATAEHSMETWQVMPVGGHVARYFIWDAMRGLDYLESRKDVDGKRLGAFGCSGGGTVTAYLAALDERVKAAASACYINTFDALLRSVGPQEAEQSIPGFIAQGLDIPDWVEMAAPRPYAIVSTTEDMFPYAGANAAYEEAHRIYGLYGAGDKLTWITGPGPHGALIPVYPQIVGFFDRWLKSGSGTVTLKEGPEPSDADLTVTPTGQMATSLGGRSFQAINAEEAARVMRKPPVIRSAGDAAALRAELRRQINKSMAIESDPGAPPPQVRVISTSERDGLRLQHLRLRTVSRLEIDVTLAAHSNTPLKQPATLLLTKAQPGAALDDAVLSLAKSSGVAMAVSARGEGPGEQKGALLGSWNLFALRTLLVGRSPLGMNVQDAIQAIDYLASRPEVAANDISVYGLGLMGPAALHLAVLDGRISSVTLDGALIDYRLAVDAPMMKMLPEVLPQGVLTGYDLPDLIVAVAPRRVTLISPTDAMGEPASSQVVETALAPVRSADAALGSSNRVKVATRPAPATGPAR